VWQKVIITVVVAVASEIVKELTKND